MTLHDDMDGMADPDMTDEIEAETDRPSWITKIEERRREIEREIVELGSALGLGSDLGSVLASGSKSSLDQDLKMDQELKSSLDLELKPAFSAIAATPTPAGLAKTTTAAAAATTRNQLANSRHELEESIKDLHNLEKFYKDKEYRKTLVSSKYPSREYFEHNDILQEETKVKQELNLPQNSTINYQKVKCSKDCKHNTPPHQYYYAYIWDSNSRKSKKKYIGKQLPLPSF